MLGIEISERTVSRILRKLPRPPMGPEPIWGSTSNVHSLDRFRASAGSSQSRSWAGSITVMNALQRNDMAAEDSIGRIHPGGRTLPLRLPWLSARQLPRATQAGESGPG